MQCSNESAGLVRMTASVPSCLANVYYIFEGLGGRRGGRFVCTGARDEPLGFVWAV